jgi:DNA-binding CsgD family transcriptional regulator
MTTVLILVWKLFVPLLFVFALIDVLTQSQEQRIRRMKRSGKSQSAIAEKLNITRYRVRMALA